MLSGKTSEADKVYTVVHKGQPKNYRYFETRAPIYRDIITLLVSKQAKKVLYSVPL